ncbi:MAG: AGE family epimerase/isomerase, partial [Duncaniella sp.]|nr:AGE family epimerase/isomerase [Duncaniella sp.]
MNTAGFSQELLDNLTTNILPYWMEKMTDPRGGFYGRRDGEGSLYEDAPKGAILNARILWTFSSAYRTLGTPEYLEAATRARDYIMEHFIDHEYGGTFWSVGADGLPEDTKKQFYAIGFMIYGLAEYFRATGDEESIAKALELFYCIEPQSRYREKDGYL